MWDLLIAVLSFGAGCLACWLWARRLLSKAATEARTDGLTGLFNRRAFDERLKAQHAQAVRYGLTYSVVLLDLDGFKQVNDTQGHAAGDALLVSIASRLQTLVRESDLPARYGGDEFVVLCPGTDEAGATVLAGRLQSSLFPDRGTASFGVAEWKLGESATGVIARADAALLSAKRGRADAGTARGPG